mgnify:CR=1 FL=1
MIKYILLIFFIMQNFAHGSIKSEIINNFKSIKNISFNFKQKIEDKIEEGKCSIVYPKKILCIYNDFYKKILVSNGKSLVINPNKNNQYYRYNLEQTPLNVILDKEFIIQKMEESENTSTDINFALFKFEHEQSLVSIYFNKKDLNIVGWTTTDVYQNKVETIISNLEKNLDIDLNIFIIQKYTN